MLVLPKILGARDCWRHGTEFSHKQERPCTAGRSVPMQGERETNARWGEPSEQGTPGARGLTWQPTRSSGPVQGG